MPLFWKKEVVGQIPTIAFKTMGHDCLSLHQGQALLCKRFIFLTYFYIQICYLHICSKETFKMAKHNVLLHKKKNERLCNFVQRHMWSLVIAQLLVLFLGTLEN